MTVVVTKQTQQHTISRPEIQAPSPELGMASLVDKPVASSDYREPKGTDYQEPKVRTIGNRNGPQTRRNAGLQRPLTMLTYNPNRIVANVRSSARASSALWAAPSARASALGRCKHSNSLLGIGR